MSLRPPKSRELRLTCDEPTLNVKNGKVLAVAELLPVTLDAVASDLRCYGQRSKPRQRMIQARVVTIPTVVA